MRKLTEWEAWVYLAMLGKNTGAAGICAALNVICYNRLISAGVENAMLRRMRKIQDTAGYWWEEYRWFARGEHCWKMAEQCDKENVA